MIELVNKLQCYITLCVLFGFTHGFSLLGLPVLLHGGFALDFQASKHIALWGRSEAPSIPPAAGCTSVPDSESAVDVQVVLPAFKQTLTFLVEMHALDICTKVPGFIFQLTAMSLLISSVLPIASRLLLPPP